MTELVTVERSRRSGRSSLAPEDVPASPAWT